MQKRIGSIILIVALVAACSSSTDNASSGTGPNPMSSGDGDSTGDGDSATQDSSTGGSASVPGDGDGDGTGDGDMPGDGDGDGSSDRDCRDAGNQCPGGQVCVVSSSGGGAVVSSGFECVANPCAGQTLDCDCASTVCDEFLICSFVQDGAVNCTMEFAAGCASPDTLIATPTGDRQISNLQIGDLVYTVDDEQTVVVPIAQVGRTEVSGHHMQRVTLASGAVLEISAIHPTADGRTFDDLQASGRLDGIEILSVESIPYEHAFTYDILPDSESGTYFAGGVLIGSTL